MVRSEEKEKFIEEVLLYKSKISKMFNALAYQLMKLSHPSAWWDAAGVYHPVLKKYAIRILSQPSEGLQGKIKTMPCRQEEVEKDHYRDMHLHLFRTT
ncbi:hypothetical protein GH714_004142 [Hevea brasiliensis]|uniref:HAT C-terminal dimerisation domain-containing protein n=1 Tax=Hevea brasiliensis TaxID=3981 RepID=A0A6A6K447_HEVBR|nr:hypothetical protein GH714_004142 [Hevea brasiliensis]